MSLVTRTPMALEIDRRDLTNRVCVGRVWMGPRDGTQGTPEQDSQRATGVRNESRIDLRKGRYDMTSQAVLGLGMIVVVGNTAS
jgi:hypothetical protein